MTATGVRAATISPASTSFDGDRAGHRRLDGGVGQRSSGSPRSARWPRRRAPAAAAISSRRAPARSRATAFVRRPGPAPLRRDARAVATDTLAAASSRCLRDPALAASSASNRWRSSVAAFSSASAAAISAGPYRPAPAPGGRPPRRDAGLQQLQLRARLVAVRLGAPQRDLDVAGIEPRQHVAGGDAPSLPRPVISTTRPPTSAATRTSVAST